MSLFKTSQGLSTSLRIKSKVLTRAYKSLHDLAPTRIPPDLNFCPPFLLTPLQPRWPPHCSTICKAHSHFRALAPAVPTAGTHYHRVSAHFIREGFSSNPIHPHSYLCFIFLLSTYHYPKFVCYCLVYSPPHPPLGCNLHERRNFLVCFACQCMPSA